MSKSIDASDIGPRDFAVLIADMLEVAGADYFISGSMGSMAYGEYRSTNDVDIVVDLRYGHLHAFREVFQHPEYYFSLEAAREAMEHCTSFKVIHNASGLKVDFKIPDESAFNASRFQRVRGFEMLPGRRVKISAPEDIILKKLEFYKLGGSDKHLRDIASMIKFSGSSFDREYLERCATTLGVTEVWAAVKSRVSW